MFTSDTGHFEDPNQPHRRLATSSIFGADTWSIGLPVHSQCSRTVLDLSGAAPVATVAVAEGRAMLQCIQGVPKPFHWVGGEQ